MNPHATTVAVVVSCLAASCGSAPPGLGASPSTELVAVSGDSVEVLSASTGAVLRSVTIAPSLATAIGAQIAVAPPGDTMYASTIVGTTCASNLVVDVDLQSGFVRVVAEFASAPAISPNGSQLAYIDYSGPACSPDTITVEDLASGRRRTWDVITTTPVAGRAPPQLLSLEWAPDGRHLVLGGVNGNFSGVQILDTDQAVGPANPRDVGRFSSDGLPGGRYSDPVERPDGSIVALEPYLWAGISDPDVTAGTAVVALDASTGGVISTLLNQPNPDAALGIDALAIDPSGTQVALVGGTAQHAGLYQLSSGVLRLVAPDVVAATWLPRA